MLETVAVGSTAPAELNLKATYVRPVGQSQWSLFIEVLETGWWLNVEGFETYPTTVDISPAAAEWLGKLSVLLGDDWPDVWDDLDGVLAMQRNAMDVMGAAFRRKVHGTPLAECVLWRQGLDEMPVEPGEMLRAQITGIDVTAGRN